MKISIRIIGIFLIFIGLLNLGGLFFIDLSSLVSPNAVIFRYSMMTIAGIGFVLLLRWGVLVYFLSVAINWIVYFNVYGGKGSVGPLWLSIPIPLIIAVISYFAWKDMKWHIGRESRGQSRLNCDIW